MRSTDHSDDTPDVGARSAARSEEDDVVSRFRREWPGPDATEGGDTFLVPDRLAAACARVLPVDGAGLSVIDGGFRLPLGASDSIAGVAEQLQFTQGEGPCLDAVRDRRAVAVTRHDMDRRWPQFWQELRARTPYRAVIGMPLIPDPGASYALDLYLIEEARLPLIGLADATRLAAAVEDVLREKTRELPLWVSGSRVTSRRMVWVAMGMVRARFGLDAADALASLRAYAYGRGDVLDTVAARLVHRTLDMDELAPHAP